MERRLHDAWRVWRTRSNRPPVYLARLRILPSNVYAAFRRLDFGDHGAGRFIFWCAFRCSSFSSAGFIGSRSDSTKVKVKGSYGIDTPYLLPIPLVVIAWNIVQGIISRSPWPFAGAALVTACMGFGLHTSRRGKFIVWAELLAELNLRGDERILDLGCGRGAVLMLAARCLTTGRAVGLDLWRRTDQSGNSLEATLRNATSEGVADRVELHTADMTALPFATNSFDVVVSNVAIHNVKDRGARNKPIQEAVRVLRPGGRLIIADIRCTADYVAQLRALGMDKVTRRNLGWRMWWTGPWLATRLVTATKPF